MVLQPSLLWLVALLSISAHANKIDISAGLFSLTAETSTQKGSQSNIGAYNVTYSKELTRNLDLTLGYSLMMANTIGGDLGFGFDLGINYYPLTTSGHIQGSNTMSYVEVNPLWRPFIGASFLQRQFQSVSTSYAGFAFVGGVERALSYGFDLKAWGRYGLLTGPRDSSATEIHMFLGIIFSLD